MTATYNAALLLCSSFAVVFLLGTQQLNVTAGRKRAAFVTSLAIGAATLVQFKVLPGPTTLLEVAAYLVGSALGIVASIAAYPRVERALRRDAANVNPPPTYAPPPAPPPPPQPVSRRISAAHWRRYEQLVHLAHLVADDANSPPKRSACLTPPPPRRTPTMPRSHKPRKRHIPKLVTIDVGLAIDRVALLTLAQRAELLAPTELAFEAFRTGRGNKGAWCNLADAMNVAEALGDLNIAGDHGDRFQAAQRVLGDVHDRAIVRRSYTLYAAEITTLDDAIFVHRIQLEHCSQWELQRAVEAVKRRVAAALAGNAGPRTRMCAPGLLGTQTETHA
jgi:hypothetical protein